MYSKSLQVSIGAMLLVLSLIIASCAVEPTATVPSAEKNESVEESVPTEASSSEPTEEVIELRVAWWGSQARHDRTVEMIELYEEQNPNIKISYEFSGWSDYWTKLNTQAAGGNLPDVVQHDYMYLSDWVSRDLLLPLDDFIDSGVIDLSDVADASVEGGRVGGILYAMNAGNGTQAFVLDVDAFEEAGMELPAQDWTWSEFEDTVLALHEKLGVWGIGATLLGDNQIWKSYHLGLGEWAYSDDGTQLGYDDDQAWVEFIEMILRLQDAGAIPTREEEVALAEEVETRPIVSGDSAMEPIWANQLVAVWTAAGETRNFKLYHLPRPEGGQPSNYVYPNMFWAVTSQAQHPEEAARFIDWYTNSVEANQILLGERGVPISSVIRDSLLSELTAAEREAVEFLGVVDADCSPVPPVDPAGNSDVVGNVYMPEFADPVMYGIISPEEGAARLREMANEILAQN
jgi:multiple sugar transport system substrate-binding protein